jgi:hypothetical protein
MQSRAMEIRFGQKKNDRDKTYVPWGLRGQFVLAPVVDSVFTCTLRAPWWILESHNHLIRLRLELIYVYSGISEGLNCLLWALNNIHHTCILTTIASSGTCTCWTRL